jgi:hypothetical protein
MSRRRQFLENPRVESASRQSRVVGPHNLERWQGSRRILLGIVSIRDFGGIGGNGIIRDFRLGIVGKEEVDTVADL